MTILEGQVELIVTSPGSKSEIESVVLVPDGGDPVVLHLRDEQSLSASPALAAYAGTRVRVEGTRGFSSFVVDRIEQL